MWQDVVDSLAESHWEIDLTVLAILWENMCVLQWIYIEIDLIYLNHNQRHGILRDVQVRARDAYYTEHMHVPTYVYCTTYIVHFRYLLCVVGKSWEDPERLYVLSTYLSALTL